MTTFSATGKQSKNDYVDTRVGAGNATRTPAVNNQESEYDDDVGTSGKDTADDLYELPDAAVSKKSKQKTGKHSKNK